MFTVMSKLKKYNIIQCCGAGAGAGAAWSRHF